MHVKGNNHLKYLYSYIHLNPAKLIDKNWKEKKSSSRGMVDYVFAYPYSSLQEYMSEQFKITEPKEFPNYFLKPKDHEKELFEWLRFTP